MSAKCKEYCNDYKSPRKNVFLIDKDSGSTSSPVVSALPKNIPLTLVDTIVITMCTKTL